MTKYVAAIIACMAAQGALAGSIYKCTVAGKVAYGDQPCADGGGLELAVRSAPPVDQAASAKLAGDRLRLLALEKERAAGELREERERQRAAKAFAVQRQKCERLRLKQKWLDEDLGRARGEAVAGARLKAKRQAEALAVECPA